MKKYWGFDSFRPKQEEIIASALEGNDTLGILPTGGGKSVCFQVPAMMKKGICIVVTPLIALMKDQVESLNKRGIPALSVHSAMTFREIDITLDNAVYGEYKFLYVSPERLRTRVFQTRVQMMDVNYLVVDEAHCICQWGYDFRPDYLKIKEIRESLSGSEFGDKVPVIALTATATAEVADDIMLQLGFAKKNVIVSGFERPNLSYVVRKAENKLGQLVSICNSVRGTGIVYVATRKKAEEIAAMLQSQGVDASAYHAGMNSSVRAAIQQAWKEDKKRVIVSTNAFGMGIDKPDVRFVCHYDIPSSPEEYFQEAGRAGRDGKRSYAVLLWNSSDLSRLTKLNNTTYPKLETVREIYQKVFIYLDIPYEDGAGRSFRFKVEEFAKHFGINSAIAYYAIKYIEISGYWTLTEELQIPSRIKMLVDRDELYGYQLSSEDTDTFLKLIMRQYPGIFSGYVTIDEDNLSRVGHYSVLSVEAKLKKLSAMGILQYIPKTKSPVLNLNNERLYDENLRLPQQTYDFLKGRAQKRIDSMTDYARETDTCRSVYLLSYFGQPAKPCGCCDICKKRNN
ncbi:MAG: RecQ family ATP-dependent DNA helicase [Bacteroidales bacterium]|nr:RecQ family ATP-dependent DNA helicase [Bacteroidales bacterium]